VSVELITTIQHVIDYDKFNVDPIVLSIDVGERNLGIALMESTRNGMEYDIAWGRVVSIFDDTDSKLKLSSKRLTKVSDNLVQMLDVIPWQIANRIVIEHQPRELMRIIQSMIVTYFISKGVVANHIKSYSGAHKLTFFRKNTKKYMDEMLLNDNEAELDTKLTKEWLTAMLTWISKSKEKYNINKRMAPLITAIVLDHFGRNKDYWFANIDPLSLDGNSQIVPEKKKDDICDAFLQGCSYIQKHFFGLKQTYKNAKPLKRKTTNSQFMVQPKKRKLNKL
jgi:hypothetical protein